MINKKYFLLLFFIISTSLSVNAIDESRGINVDPTIDGINTIITPRGIEVNPSFFIGGNTNGTFNSLQGPYLYNISETIYLNDSLFCLSNGTNCLSTSSGNSSWNQSLANTLYQPLGNTKSGSGPYLTNSSTSISVIESYLNGTITNIVTTLLVNVAYTNIINNFTDIQIFDNIAGFWGPTYFFDAMNVLGGGSLTVTDGSFNTVKTGPSIVDGGPYMGVFINTNTTGEASYSLFTPGGGQLNFFAGGPNGNGQFANRSAIQGANIRDIGVENVIGGVTITASKATHSLPQINVSEFSVGLTENTTFFNDTFIAGNKLFVNNNTNSIIDSCYLVGGSCIISNTRIMNTTIVQCSIQQDGGTVGSVRVSSRNVGSNYTVTSTSILDTSLVGCVLYHPSG